MQAKKERIFSLRYDAKRSDIALFIATAATVLSVSNFSRILEITEEQATDLDIQEHFDQIRELEITLTMVTINTETEISAICTEIEKGTIEELELIINNESISLDLLTNADELVFKLSYKT
jgi:hypothetical protein